MVDVTGGVSCEVTGFSLAIGHDPDRVRFAAAQPGSFLVSHAGENLFFHVAADEEEGFSVIAAIFDISFPITVAPTTIDADTVLAALTYDVLAGTPPGDVPLLNRTRTYGDPNPIANVYSGPPGAAPIEPELSDGAITVEEEPAEPRFIRGDAGGNEAVDLSDVIFLLSYLFRGGEPPPCLAATDVNGSGAIDISDPIYLLLHFFRAGSAPPPAPYPSCGVDPVREGLPCEAVTCG